MDRRQFLRAGIIGAGGAAALPSAAVAGAQTVGPGPYGSLDGIEPDENGIVLPPTMEIRTPLDRLGTSPSAG